MALYAYSIVHICLAHEDEARTGAERVLGITKTDANPHLACLFHGQVDLECYALDVMIQICRHDNPELVDVTLSTAACTPAKQRKPGSS